MIPYHNKMTAWRNRGTPSHLSSQWICGANRKSNLCPYGSCDCLLNTFTLDRREGMFFWWPIFLPSFHFLVSLLKCYRVYFGGLVSFCCYLFYYSSIDIGTGITGIRIQEHPVRNQVLTTFLIFSVFYYLNY